MSTCSNYIKRLKSVCEDYIMMYHLRMVEFEKYLKQFRQHIIDNIESTATMALPFHLQSQILEKFHLCWTNRRTRAVYVELCGHEEQYNVANSNSGLEVCRLRKCFQIIFITCLLLQCQAFCSLFKRKLYSSCVAEEYVVGRELLAARLCMTYISAGLCECNETCVDLRTACIIHTRGRIWCGLYLDS